MQVLFNKESTARSFFKDTSKVSMKEKPVRDILSNENGIRLYESS